MDKDLRYFRKSYIILIGDLIFLEIIFIFFYLIVRIPKTLILPSFIEIDQEPIINSLGIFYFIFISLIQIVLVLTVVLRWANEEYVINEDTVIHKKGIFKTKYENYSLRNLGNVTVTQGFLGKIFKFGTIKLYSTMLKQEYFITNVHNPHHILKAIEDDLSKSNDKGTIIRRS